MAFLPLTSWIARVSVETITQFLHPQESSRILDVAKTLHLWSKSLGIPGEGDERPCWFLRVYGSAQTGCQLMCMQELSKNIVYFRTGSNKRRRGSEKG